MPCADGGRAWAEHIAHRRRELRPASPEFSQAFLARRGDRVIAPGPLAFLVTPLADDKAGVAQPVQQRIYRAVARQQAVRGGKIANKLQAEPRPDFQQGEHAWSEDAPPELSHAHLGRHA
jgi:hypothetical protein